MNTTSESLLIRLRSSSDQMAWSRFVDLYTPLLFYWARKTGIRTVEASDLVQEVLSIVFQKLPDFEYDRGRSFRGWLRTITLNKYREWCRKKSIGAALATHSVLGQVSERNGKSDLAESTWDLNYQQALVSRALDLLEPEFQPKTWQALKLYLKKERSTAEIAEQIGVSVWTIYSAKSKLMSRLKEELDGLIE